jgi:hypothetical protein
MSNYYNINMKRFDKLKFFLYKLIREEWFYAKKISYSRKP